MNTATSATWEFDAPQDDPLTALRIPVVCFNPTWYYIAALDVDSVERPTDNQAKMIASYIEQYKSFWYAGSFLKKLAERPFDVDGGCNTIVFKKYLTNDWAYRRVSWVEGPMYVPSPPWTAGRKLGPLTLLQVMDRAQSFGDEPNPHWVKWKNQHLEIFGEEQ